MNDVWQVLTALDGWSFADSRPSKYIISVFLTDEVKARRPRLVLEWVATRDLNLIGRCEPGSVRRRGLESVTDRLIYSHYRADTDVK